MNNIFIIYNPRVAQTEDLVMIRRKYHQNNTRLKCLKMIKIQAFIKVLKREKYI